MPPKGAKVKAYRLYVKYDENCEFIIASGNSPGELAKQLGIDSGAVSSAISRGNPRYRRFEWDDLYEIDNADE